MILSTVRLRNYPEEEADDFPWNLPLVKNLGELVFEKNISFFVGDNGSGKSTILESIAAYTEVPLAGSHRLEDDDSLAAANRLADYLTLRYVEKSHHGFFVRAEDFIGFARHIKNEIRQLEKEIEEVKENWTGGDIKLTLGAIEGEKKPIGPTLYSRSRSNVTWGRFLKIFHITNYC